ncbi:sodium channel subunit beta-3 isoform X2 [Betta splendens]|uniref:Sodium channel regulatory subunit beta-3 n=1 Tax=Betta splendens TaxID=158456 RepID=A0A6P7P734_BETSP|nr:sodium channel subunit beta-3 isoform X2 [Betta splendens]
MVTQHRVHLQTLLLLTFVVHLSQPVCVDVEAEKEAVVGKPKKLSCIACMKREEVKAKTRVEWLHKGKGDNQTHLISQYDGNKGLWTDYTGRLTWNGSQDLQDLSIEIVNVTFDDGGFYQCKVFREFEFNFFTHSDTITRNITLHVREKASDDVTAIYSEIMMYVLLVFLTLWLLFEMVYCYRKISKSDEQAQDTAY